MRLSQHLIETFSDFVRKKRPVALVTVLSTSGSTYSKAGSQMLIGADGSTRHLGAGDFQLLPLEVWRDGEGTEWPVSWRVQMDEEIWRVTAVVDDQRMDTSVTYWEGLVLAHDVSGERVGRGYLELTGYGDVAAER